MESTTRLRHLLDGPELLLVPGAYNALSAQLIERVGFKATMLGGSAVTNTLFGAPDVGHIGLTDMANMVSYVSNAVNIPVIVDADTGYGNAINLSRAIRVLEKAGASGVIIEDQISPKRSGHVAGRQVISREEMIGKLKAAVDARTDPNFVIISRCDARDQYGVEEVIARGNVYAEAGADVIFSEGALSKEELESFAKVKAKYHLVNMGGSAKKRTTPKLSLDELRNMGYEVAIFALQLVRASSLAMWKFLSDLRDLGIEADIKLIDSLAGYDIEDWYAFTGFPQVRAMEEKYLPRDEVEQKYLRATKKYYVPSTK